MRIFIDTISRGCGGYINHLRGILAPGNIPKDIEIIVNCDKSLVTSIGSVDKNVIFNKENVFPVNRFVMKAWRLNALPKIIKYYSPDVVFSPSGNIEINRLKTIKYVTMSRNLQPHIASERRRLPIYTYERLRLEILHKIFNASLRRADGVIFLSNYAKEIILSKNKKIIHNIVIPHGIRESFRRPPSQKPIGKNIKILYVSDFNIYKNQWNVARAIDILKNITTKNIRLQLIGNQNGSGYKLWVSTLSKLGYPNWIEVISTVNQKFLIEYYHNADLFVFASTIENFPNIFLEAMASGLPIAYSKYRPMPDIIKNSGSQFDPLNPNSIAEAINKLLIDDDYRFQCAKKAYEIALNYSWKMTSAKTYEFIKKIAFSK